MAKGLPYSMSRGAALRQEVIKQDIVINGSLDITGVAATVDAGTFVIGGLPEGNILLLGAVAYVGVDATGDADVIDNFAGDYGIGTAPNANVDLADPTDTDIIPSTALLAGGADKIVTSTRGASTQTQHSLILDNTDGSLELNLNLLIDDNVITDVAVGTFAVTGVLHLAYTMLGDD